MWTTTVEIVDDTPFSAYVHKTVKEKLEAGLKAMEGFDNGSRQYEVFQDYQKLLKQYQKINTTLGELKSEAMKPRHWKDLL